MPGRVRSTGGGVRRLFAGASPFFVFLAVLLIFGMATRAAEPTATVKHQAAEQFARAEQQRAALNVKPAAKRTLTDYRQVITTYRRIYLTTPRASEVPDAWLAIAQLYGEMGEHYGRAYYQLAVDSYRILLRDFPSNRMAPDALLACAKIQRDQLADYSGATQSYQEFLKRYARSPRKREAQEGVAELAMLQNSGKAPESATGSTAGAESLPRSEDPGEAAETSSAMSGSATGAPRLRRIRSSSTDDITRVTIDLESAVQYGSGRLTNPDRIFFDLHEARVAPEVAREAVPVDGETLTAVRIAQNHAGVVRLVLDVHGVKEYGVSTSENPPQLLIDLFRKKLPPSAEKVARASHNSQVGGSPGSLAARREKAAASIPELTDRTDTETVVATKNIPRGNAGRAVPSAPLASANAAPTSHGGPSTLTRALGLKIGRIVIDAGHGGHDTGTIGPTGLMEKDLCLDVALRLGKIIKQRLPGAEVVFTRSDDSFIPLEERTALANEARADLFISIHANSSQDHLARGIETYYLNLKGSPDAMEVAARENAVSAVGIHDLEDLVKKIARNEKIDESKEFAEDIQNSLAQRVQKINKTVKNRGVRRAPFVVLIGADMPSILTEISFLSNPADEQLLKKPEHRQRLAEGLYQGVASYLQSLNSMTLNTPGSVADGTSTKGATKHAGAAKLAQSRNEQ